MGGITPPAPRLHTRGGGAEPQKCPAQPARRHTPSAAPPAGAATARALSVAQPAGLGAAARLHGWRSVRTVAGRAACPLRRHDELAAAWPTTHAVKV